MNKTTIHLGYEIGDPTGSVHIPLRNMVVVGQTQESGKTTAMEALVDRSGRTAIAFVTKRGEGSFAGAHRVPPYFRQRSDWQYVSSLLESAMREKLKFERSWIIKACKGAADLAAVQANVQTAMETARRGLDQSVYTCLNEYLKIVLPQIKALPAVDKMRLSPGMNVMDLSAYSTEIQMLVVASTLEWVYTEGEKIITIIPEAWEFLPQQRGSPVKLAAIALIRKGSALGNYLWLDSQDIGGIEKEILRSCPVWLIGVQREAHEIKRNLAQLEVPAVKPRAKDIMSLGIGEFYACWAKNMVRVYAQPAWLHDEVAEAYAKAGGSASGQEPPPQPGLTIRAKNFFMNEAHELPPELKSARGPARLITERVDDSKIDTVIVGKKPTGESAVTEAEANALRQRNRELEERLLRLETAAATRSPHGSTVVTVEPCCGRDHDGDGNCDRHPPGAERFTMGVDVNKAIGVEPVIMRGGVIQANESELLARVRNACPGVSEDFFEPLYQLFKARLSRDAPSVLQILVEHPELRLKIDRPVVEVGGESLRGRFGMLIHDGFVDHEAKGTGSFRAEAKRRFGTDPGGGGTLATTLDRFVREGFLTKEGTGYLAVPGQKKRLTVA